MKGTKMYKSILLPVDLNQESSWNRTLPVAVDMAKSMSAKIHVVTVIPDFGMAVVGSFFPANYEENAKKETQSALDAFVKDNLPTDLIADAVVLSGTIYKEIIQSAEASNCDLIVMASHRPETKDYLLGPNAARVVRHAQQSVFVVRNN